MQKKIKQRIDFCSWELESNFNVNSFHHSAMRRLNESQRTRFDSELSILCHDYLAIIKIESRRPDNQTIKEALESILGHLSRLDDSITGSDYFAMILCENAQSEADTQAVLQFQTKLRIVKILCERALSNKSFAQKISKAQIPESIAASSRMLLKKYGIKPVLTPRGAWDSLFQHILTQLGIKKNFNQRKNYMRSAKCKITEKSGGKIHRK